MWVTSMPQVWDEEGAAKGGAVTPAPAAAMLGSLAGWLSRTVQPQPPAPRVCGTAGGPPVTAPRLRLRDGRHLAYCESGVPRTQARFTVVFSHGFTGSREDSVRASQVPTDPSTTTMSTSLSFPPPSAAGPVRRPSLHSPASARSMDVRARSGARLCRCPWNEDDLAKGPLFLW
jgi:hypothetical protein